MNGDSNVAFFRALRAAGVTPDKTPTISFSISEEELSSLSPRNLIGDYAAWNYFQSIDRPQNRAFVKRFQARYGAQRVLSDPMEAAFQVNQRAAGNGSLMRASTSAVYFAGAAQEVTMDAARRIAALTHGDRAAWEGTAIFHELIRVTFEGIDPVAALADVLTRVHPDHRGRYAAVLAPDWHPDRATEFNGAVWPCLGSAVWALRTTDSFERAIRAAIDLGGDTDTVAAVTGGIAGAYYGLDAIPTHWSRSLHVPLPGFDGRVLHLADLLDLAHRLAR